eukprot:1195851-Prorocentrum_minimum.AAC.17
MLATNTGLDWAYNAVPPAQVALCNSTLLSAPSPSATLSAPSPMRSMRARVPALRVAIPTSFHAPHCILTTFAPAPCTACATASSTPFAAA